MRGSRSTAFTLDGSLALALAGRPQLSDQPRLFQLGEDADNLAHRLAHSVIRRGQFVAIASEYTHPAGNQGDDAKLLSKQVAREPAGVFDDRANTIIFDEV
jgi:hypothetical protein